MNRKSRKLVTVQGPDSLRDKLIPLHPDGAEAIGARFGAVPSRATLFRWRKTGYPVGRDGRGVILPHIRRLQKVLTSVPALTRWFEAIDSESEKQGV